MSQYKYENPFTKRIVSITGIEKYSCKSFEEMRWEYYQEMLKDEAITDEAKSINDPKFDNELKSLPKNEALKRGYFSESEDSRIFKKIRYDENVSDSELVNEEVPLNKGFKRTIGLDLQFDLLSSSMNKKIKLEKLRNIKRRAKQQVDSIDIAKDLTEDRRIVTVIDELRKKGNVYFKEGSYSIAYQCYSDALSISTKHVKLASICQSNRALTLLKMNRLSDALVDCISAVSLDPNNCKAQIRKIKCLMELENYVDAEEELIYFNKRWKLDEGQKLLKIVTMKLRLTLLIGEGDTLIDKGMAKEALCCYNDAINIDGNIPSLYNKRASVLFLLKRYNDSLNDSDKALILLPNNDASFQNRIKCLVMLERFNEAIREAQQLQERTCTQEHKDLLLWSITIQKQFSSRNYYEILGVSSSATLSEIKKRYRKQILLYHPDKLFNCDQESKNIQEEKFKELNKILGTLSDPVSRKIYDIKISCK